MSGWRLLCAKVITRTKILALACKHNSSRIGISIQFIKHIRQTMNQIDIEKIVGGSSDGYNGDMALAIKLYVSLLVFASVYVSHRTFPKSKFSLSDTCRLEI